MRDNGDYKINSEGRDSSNWSSRPGSDRFGNYESNLQNTEDVYDSCGCNQPISEADREKRIEELDELIHDKLGKYDEDNTGHTEHIRSEQTDHHTIKNHVTDTPSSATKANNDAIATGSTIGATSSVVGEQTGKIGDESNQADMSGNIAGEPTDCSSDMSINDLASYSDTHNGLSDDTDNDGVIVVEQVDIIIDSPEQDDPEKDDTTK
ncbi:MAG: hypothetical protein LUF04_05220 [Bacteroides sp.]|nr:hypothetical protein [Bacteroides sp.]